MILFVSVLSAVTIIILYFILKNIVLCVTWIMYSNNDAVDLEMTYLNTITKLENSE